MSEAGGRAFFRRISRAREPRPKTGPGDRPGAPPRVPGTGAARALGPPGALLAAGGLFSAILAIKRVGGGEAATGGTALAAVAGAVLLALFVRRRRAPQPLIDLRALTRPAFGTSVGCIVLTVLALVGLALIAAQYLQLVLGPQPRCAGPPRTPWCGVCTPRWWSAARCCWWVWSRPCGCRAG